MVEEREGKGTEGEEMNYTCYFSVKSQALWSSCSPWRVALVCDGIVTEEQGLRWAGCLAKLIYANSAVLKHWSPRH